MAPTAVAAGTPHRPNIRVSLADNGGWLVTVERDSRVVITEHYTDWHRVERRVAVLESSVMPDCAHASRPKEGFDAHMGQMIKPLTKLIQHLGGHNGTLVDWEIKKYETLRP